MYSDPAFGFSVLCWVVLWVYCLLSARKQKEEKKREPGLERLRQIVPMAAAYFLLLDPGTGYGGLGARFVPARGVLQVAGALLTAAGVALAIRARWHLGENWSARVSIRAGHELIRTGPYRSIRHPIYTGMILATAGTALVIGEVRGLLALAITLISFYLKARKEELWLAEEFPVEFADQAKHTGMFLPRLS